MAYVYAKINKHSLRFIREQKCVSRDYIVQALKLKAEKFNSWEDPSCDVLPTINQAKNVAKCLRVPFAGLYMNPADILIKRPPARLDLRTLPNHNFDDSGTNLAVVDLIQIRDFYFDICKELNIAVPDFSVQISIEDDIACWAQLIRQKFQISMSEQYKLASARQLFLYLKRKVEDNGVFIQCFSGVDTDVLRGLAISFKKMPVIGINEDDYYPAKSFTIIHELVHIIKRHSVVCNNMYNSFSTRVEEIFCNAVAGEVLVPTDELKKLLSSIQNSIISLQLIENLSKKFSVSKEVIIRRLLDTGYIDSSTYKQFARQIQEMFDDQRRKLREQISAELAPPIRRIMYREAIDKTSSRLCTVLYKGFTEGVLQKQDISRYLGLEQKHIGNFISEVSKWS